MEAKHTPGPWTYLSGTTTCEKVLGADGKVVADGWWCRSVEEVDANSRLIAAAPDLLEALRETMFALSGAVAILYSGAELTEEFGEKVSEARRTFHAAIAKATTAA